MRRLIMAAGLMAVVSAEGASAATVITMATGPTGAESKSQTLILDSDKMRMSTGQGGVLFRADTGKMTVIDDNNRTYMEFSPESMQKMRDNMQAMMQQRLAALPPEQRKQVEAMMAQHGGPGMGAPAAPEAPRVVTYQKSGDPRKVGQWTCAPYTMIVNGKPESELCVTKMSDLGLTHEDFQSFIKLSETMAKQMGGMGGGHRPAVASADYESLTKTVGYEAFPVQTSHLRPGSQLEVESTIQSVEHKDAPAGTFDIPAGYTKRDMGAMMGGGQH
jgi:hypothetical protein